MPFFKLRQRRLLDLLFCLSICEAGSSLAQAQTQNEAGAFLSMAQGKVTLNGKDAKVGAKVIPGDVILTQEGARAAVLMKRVGYLQIGSASRVIIEHALFRKKGEPSEVSIEVAKGVARALIRSTQRPDRPTFKVRSATATMGVRGTEVLVAREQADSAPTFATVRGEAELVQGSDVRVMRAGQGFQTTSRGFEPVVVTETFKQAVVKRVGGETQEVRSLKDLEVVVRDSGPRDRTPVEPNRLKRARERLRDPGRDGSARVRFIGSSRRTL